MSKPIRSVLVAVVTALVRSRRAGFGNRAGLPEPTDHAGDSAAARRHQRHHGARGRRQAQRRRSASRSWSRTARPAAAAPWRPARSPKARPTATRCCWATPPRSATAPSMYPNVGYDPRKDFAPIGLIASAPALLLVHPSMTVRNVSRADRPDQELDRAVPGRHARHQHGQSSRRRAVCPAGRRQAAAHSLQGLAAR